MDGGDVEVAFAELADFQQTLLQQQTHLLQVLAEKQALRETVLDLESQVSGLQRSNDALQSALGALQGLHSGELHAAGEYADAVTQLREERTWRAACDAEVQQMHGQVQRALATLRCEQQQLGAAVGQVAAAAAADAQRVGAYMHQLCQQHRESLQEQQRLHQAAEQRAAAANETLARLQAHCEQLQGDKGAAEAEARAAAQRVRALEERGAQLVAEKTLLEQQLAAERAQGARGSSGVELVWKNKLLKLKRDLEEAGRQRDVYRAQLQAQRKC